MDVQIHIQAGGKSKSSKIKGLDIGKALEVLIALFFFYRRSMLLT